MRPCLKFLILICLSTASNCFAVVVDAMPAYTISPTLNGLNIAYFAQQDRIKITLYLVNHEHFPVTCDAKYQGGPDTENTREQTVLPEKAIAFTFSYPKKADNVSVQFICIKAATAQNENETPTDAKSSDTAPPDSTTILETDLSITR